MRPDLTAAIADHVLEMAAIAGDQGRWLSAAAWAVHARAATGDGRETASDVIGQLSRWGRAPLDSPAARRLRIELAQVAAGAGEVETARGLLGPVVVDESEPELRADLLCALARCAVEEDAPGRVSDALRAASAAWSAVPGPPGEVGAASVALISAVVERRGRRPDAAVEQAAEGLTRLERGRGDGSAGTPSGHLAAALAAEWISALLDAGRSEEARDGCVPLMPRLAEPARPSRQLALLRLTVARAVATGAGAASSVELMAQAADDAAAADAPDLESVCRTALGALQEKTGPLETALETLRLGVAAERRDRARAARFRSALTEIPRGTLRPATKSGIPDARTADTGRASTSSAHRAPDSPASSGSGYSWDAFLRDANARGRAGESGGKRRRDDRDPVREHQYDTNDGSSVHHGSDQSRDPHSDEPSWRSPEPEPTGWSWPSGTGADDRSESGRSASSADWSLSWEEAGESPIGDLLFRSLRSDSPPADEPGPSGTERRNGTNGHRARESARRHESGASEPTRNGRSRPQPDERSVERSETRGSHPRPSGDDDLPTGRESGTVGPEPSADSWLSAKAADVWGTYDNRQSARRSRPSDEDSWSFGDVARSDEPNGSRRSRSDPRPESQREPHSESRRGSSPEDDRPVGGGWRHRTEDLSSTGERPAARGGDDERDRGGSAGAPAEPLSPARPTGGSDDAESWLRAAIAELDRVWGTPEPGGEPLRHTDTPQDRQPSQEAAESCSVIIDVARDGRRFAGPRAGAVVRAVADRLTDRLPLGAHLKLGDSDALSISLPGWDRAAATEWMHRTLPGLLAGFDSGEDLPSAQLRAAVHDTEGPVGAQILQSLEPSSVRRHGAGSDRGPSSPGTHNGQGQRPADAGRSGRRHAEDQDTPERERRRKWDGPERSWETAGSAGRHGASLDAEPGGHRRDPGSGSATAADSGNHRHRRGSESEPAPRDDRVGRPPALSARDSGREKVSEPPRSRARDAGRDTERGGGSGSGSSGSGSSGSGSSGSGSSGSGSSRGVGAGSGGTASRPFRPRQRPREGERTPAQPCARRRA